MLNMNGQIFLFHSSYEMKSVHFWATVLGNDKTAEKNVFYLNIKSDTGNPRKVRELIKCTKSNRKYIVWPMSCR